MKLQRLLLPVALVCLAWGFDSGETLRLGRIELTVPDGWTGRVDGERIVLNLQGIPSGAKAEIAIGKDLKPEGSFRQWFYDLWADALKDKPVAKKEFPAWSQTNTSQSFIAYAELSGGGRLVAAAHQTDKARLLGWYSCSSPDLISKGRDLLPQLLKSATIGSSPSPTGAPATTGQNPAAPKPPTSDPGKQPGARDPGPARTGWASVPLQPGRLNRLGDIAKALQDPKSDAITLLTEAVGLCGLSIWREDRTRIAEPSAAPPLKLAVTDAEIREFTEMFRAGHSVALGDLIGAVDVLYKGIGSTKSCEPHVTAWLENGLQSDNPSICALTSFILDLGAQHEDPSAVLPSSDARLDPIQALLVLRVLTEDIGVPLRKALAKIKVNEFLVSTNPAPPQVAVSGEAEDAFVGVTNLHTDVIELMGKEETTIGKVSKAAGMASAIASIIKFIATYCYLKCEFRIESPGQPLLRTKDYDPGDNRTVVARFFIDGNRVFDWMKDNRQIVALAGLDIEMPKSGALKGVETEWQLDQSRKYYTKQLIGAVPGTGDLSKIKTNDNGEARVTFEGRPQQAKIDPAKAMPIEKTVKITVTPQTKSTEMSQDLVDAVFGAIGVRGGPGMGFITPVIESLYRMKWAGGKAFILQVRDWTESDAVGEVSIIVYETGHDSKTPGDGSGWEKYTKTVRRAFSFNDTVMTFAADTVVPKVDAETLRRMSPEQRANMEAGLKQMATMATKRQFMAIGPGVVSLRIRDKARRWGEWKDCGTAQFNIDEAWTGENEIEFSPKNPSPERILFMIDVDLEKKVAAIAAYFSVKAKYTVDTTVDKGQVKHDEHGENMSVFSDLALQSPFDGNKPIITPLKEMPVAGTGMYHYYGEVDIPFKFGPDNKFSGVAKLTWSVVRRAKKGK